MGTIDFTDSIYDAQQGSQSAVKFIYDNTIQLFFKEAAVFMRNTEDADEAVRDAYIFIFDHLNSLEDTSKFLLWANEVCKNTCISKLKRANVFRERIPAEAANLGEVLSAADYDPYINWSASMSADHIRICLGAVLDSLPDSQRVCAILWGEGYPLRSISRKLGISTTAVNYMIACTLGSITNAVSTLGENGLPLFSMDPIPFFLWLLLSFYQSYQPEDVNLGPESAFSNILRILMPEEASLYGSDYDEDFDDTDAQNAADEFFESFDPSASGVSVAPGYDDIYYDDSESSASEENTVDSSDSDENTNTPDNGFDISDFINGDTKAEETVKPVEKEDAEEDDDALPIPPMEVYTADNSEAADSIFISPVTEAEASDQKEESAEEKSQEETSGVASELLAGLAAENAAEGNADSSSAAEGVTTSSENAVAENAQTDGQTADSGKKKSHKGLIIFLIILVIILCLAAGAYIFYGNYIKNTINNLLGTPFFITEEMESTTEAEPESTTEAETTTEPQTTTVEETTTEPETTTEEFVGPEYNVQIYADGEALNMKSEPEGGNVASIPSEQEVTIYEVQDGWGRTSYDGEDGWIWLEWTKVSGKAPVQKPDAASLLQPAETRILNEDAELRIAPLTPSSTFGPVPEGSELSVEAYIETEYYGTWAYTSYNGNHGWIPVESFI